ncbi:unnamed protein product [Brachionus calyciflorus]|uniref:Coronin n=1 Tax=Brachionus calyciflorus TaxID=104777 RepID=A0A813SGH9_9BILA|nr:unnamed protein product [Brachionus calyciflorus]
MPVLLNSGSVKNTTLTSQSTSSMNYVRSGMSNSSLRTLKQSTNSSSSISAQTAPIVSNNTVSPTTASISASSFSKLRSNFIKPEQETKKLTFNSIKNNSNNTAGPKKILNVKTSCSITTEVKNKLDDIPKRVKTNSITNSDDELINLESKYSSGTSSTISSLSSSDQSDSIDTEFLVNQNKSQTTLEQNSFKMSLKINKNDKINNEMVQSTTTTHSSSSSPSSHRSSPTSRSGQMPFKIRSSKYRHVYGNPHKEDVCYKNIKITKNAAHDSAFSAANPKFVAIVTEECGGGAFVVIPIKQTGRIDINTPKVTGHRGPVLDLKWNPFNDNEIASCSEDATIKVWQMPDDGLYENLNEWVSDLHGHQRKVTQIEWHPTAENIMISSGADFQVILWNLEKAEPIRIVSCHNDTIQSMNWNRDGSLFATTCKDKKLRVIEPRSGKVICVGDGHQGSKISKVVFLGCGTKLFTTGFSRLSERQIAIWNINDLSKPIQMDVVDCSSGVLIPYYDYDTNIVFVAGKGDGNIRYYEITDMEPYIHYLSEYKSATPQRGLGWMPKRGLDVTKNEIFRFYKLHATGGICEPISMIVPRKSEVFQEDIYPDTCSGIPSLSCDEWLSGENREPILMSMKDGAVPFMPKIVTYKQLGFSELSQYSRSFIGEKKLDLVDSNKLVETTKINTKLTQSSRSAFNKMSSSSSYSSSPPSSPTQNRKFSDSNDTKFDAVSCDELKTVAITTTTTSVMNNSSNESVNQDEFVIVDKKQSEELEASYITNVSKNPITLRKTESLRIESVQSIRNRFDRVNLNLSRNKTDIMNNSIEENSQRSTSPPNLVGSPLHSSFNNAKQTTPIPLLLNTSNNSSFTQTPSNNNNETGLNGSCIKKRVWTPVQSSSNLTNSKLNESTNSPNDLQKSYFRLLEERNNLKERNKKLEDELATKDKRIRDLEQKLKIFNLKCENDLESIATDC